MAPISAAPTRRLVSSPATRAVAPIVGALYTPTCNRLGQRRPPLLHRPHHGSVSSRLFEWGEAMLIVRVFIIAGSFQWCTRHLIWFSELGVMVQVRSLLA